jgi:hypothetical protein
MIPEDIAVYRVLMDRRCQKATTIPSIYLKRSQPLKRR